MSQGEASSAPGGAKCLTEEPGEKWASSIVLYAEQIIDAFLKSNLSSAISDVSVHIIPTR